ncbi:hypothetical protein CJ030_MR6G019430 [Morella rubra]|uniref:Uncharacterized protein n=1 Tax=Morella rubra TaxID=262757 RepID=A0A6A1VDW3_9ROSI|nr:hypothetical protein CJ030_MR6G019430 [Morella rubra]
MIVSTQSAMKDITILGALTVHGHNLIPSFIVVTVAHFLFRRQWHLMVEACLKTSYTEQNFGCRLLSCVNYKFGRSCGFFHWYDPPMCVHSKKVLRRLWEKHENLNTEVDSHVSMAEHGTAHKNAELEVIISQLCGELSQLRSELETIKRKTTRISTYLGEC